MGQAQQFKARQLIRLALPLALRLSIITLGLLALLINTRGLLLQDLPDYRNFESLFTPSPACDLAACLMGIQPGMPIREALSLLRQHAWVKTVSLPAIGTPTQFDHEAVFHWRWNGQQPDFVNADRSGHLYVDASTGHVYRIEVEAFLRFEAIDLSLGDAWARQAIYWPANDRIRYKLSFQDRRATAWTAFETEVPCPAQLLQYVSLTRTLISQNSVPPFQVDTPPGQLAAMCREENFGH